MNVSRQHTLRRFQNPTQHSITGRLSCICAARGSASTRRILQNTHNRMLVMRKKIRKARSNHGIGYGRPPTSTQFQPGQSGNPAGRPRGARNVSSLAREALERPINVKVKGASRKMTVRKAAYLRLAERAVAGDVKALDYLLALEKRRARTPV